VKDCECLMGTKGTDDFKEDPIGSWTNDEYSVSKLRLPNFVLRNEVSDGMRNVGFGRSMFKCRLEDVNTAIS